MTEHARIAFDTTPTLAAGRALVELHGTFVSVAPHGVTFPAGWPSVVVREDAAPAPLPADLDSEANRLALDATKEDNTMTDTRTHEFIWLDLETTGLDPHNGALLEFAAVLCEDARGDDFAVVAQYSGVVHHHVDDLAVNVIDPYVTQMHTRNGLWHDVATSTTTLAEVDEFLASVAASLTGGRKRAVSLAGSSVHFDLAWCRVHLPRFAEYLSHRVFDVTTLRRAVDAWAPAPVVWPTRDAHRALADVLATIDEARIARRAMFGGAA